MVVGLSTGTYADNDYDDDGSVDVDVLVANDDGDDDDDDDDDDKVMWTASQSPSTRPNSVKPLNPKP